MATRDEESGGIRAVMRRVRLLLNPLGWLAGGARPEHRTELVNVVDHAAAELGPEKRADQEPPEAPES
jgi:hypothetical protein